LPSKYNGDKGGEYHSGTALAKHTQKPSVWFSTLRKIPHIYIIVFILCIHNNVYIHIEIITSIHFKALMYKLNGILYKIL
jgi:hypothetical protein